jgi:DNA polymerase III subunit epsilon
VNPLFVAIDIETANADLASICQVGVVVFAGGAISDRWTSLVNPHDEFSAINVSIHGITEESVAAAPSFADISGTLFSHLGGRVVVSHTWFDRLAVQRASERNGVSLPLCEWLDSAKVVRRTWVQHAQSGYGLAKIAAELGISYRAHEAIEDARAAGEIVLRAYAQATCNFTEWREAFDRPVPSNFAREGNPDGPLFGHVLVFTGALEIPRREASLIAAQAGCTVASGVNRETTLLVVGDQDIRKTAGQEKSTKHRKAESLITAGQSIRILSESDFRRVVSL